MFDPPQFAPPSHPPPHRLQVLPSPMAGVSFRSLVTTALLLSASLLTAAFTTALLTTTGVWGGGFSDPYSEVLGQGLGADLISRQKELDRQQARMLVLHETDREMQAYTHTPPPHYTHHTRTHTRTHTAREMY